MSTDTITIPPMPTLPPTPAAKKPRRWPWLVGIAASSVLCLGIGIGIGSAGGSADAAPVTDQPVAAQPAEDEPVAEPEPVKEPAKVEGSLATPYPLGYVVSVYEGSVDNTLADVTVAIKDGNAGVAIAQANRYNDAAAPGSHYVAVEYTVTGQSAVEPTDVSYMLYDWSLATTDGTLIPETSSSVVLPDGWNQTYDVADLYQGQSASVVVVYQIPDAYTGTLYATAFGKYVTL